jgi:hypothetical protein
MLFKLNNDLDSIIMACPYTRVTYFKEYLTILSENLRYYLMSHFYTVNDPNFSADRVHTVTLHGRFRQFSTVCDLFKTGKA